VWASSFRPEPVVEGHEPAFGIYLDERWSPPWPHVHVAWPDFGLPTDVDDLRLQLGEGLRRARAGEVVELACLGGHGRTGTALGALAVLAGLPEGSDPVAWVRTAYCERAIETDGQLAFVRSFRAEA
jgi:protein-tyrosine phosphatase